MAKGGKNGKAVYYVNTGGEDHFDYFSTKRKRLAEIIRAYAARAKVAESEVVQIERIGTPEEIAEHIRDLYVDLQSLARLVSLKADHTSMGQGDGLTEDDFTLAIKIEDLAHRVKDCVWCITDSSGDVFDLDEPEA